MPSLGPRPRIYGRVIAHLRPYFGQLLLVLLLELLGIPLALLVPVPLKLAVDGLTGTAHVPAAIHPLLHPNWSHQGVTLVLAALLMVAVGLLQHALGFGNWLLQTSASERIIMNFRAQLFEHVQRLSLAYHDRQRVGDAAYRIQYDAPALAQIAIRAVIPSISALLTLVGMLYVTARLDWQMALLAVVLAPCLFFATRRYSGRVHEEWTELRDRDSRAMSIIHETLGALRVVKAFGQERREHRRFLRHSGEYVRGQMSLALKQSGFVTLVGLTIVAAGAVGLVIGARHVLAGLLTVGDLLLLMSYLGKLYEPLGTLSGKTVEIQSALVSVERAFALLDEAPDVEDRPSARRLKRAAGDVEFRSVSFGYNPRHPVLRDVSLRVPAGTRVGILGRTGAGKSTLLSLLARLYDPSSGSILLDGIDLRDYAVRDLRHQFGIVLQEPVLFSATIAENIAYTQPRASRASVIAAAQSAYAHGFIVGLPAGYDTQVGARGMSLSGGERQRIALARAFLTNAPILVLDEPTSAVDLATEAAIVAATEALMRGRTTFVITHRPGMLRHCDVQYELRDGALVEVDWSVEAILASAAPADAGRVLPWSSLATER